MRSPYVFCDGKIFQDVIESLSTLSDNLHSFLILEINMEYGEDITLVTALNYNYDF